VGSSPVRERAHDPRDLVSRLVSREHTGDVEGMAALYEAGAVLDPGDGQLIRGREVIRTFYAAVVATGRKFDFGQAVIRGDLALTSHPLPDGTAEVARKQSGGTWLWAVDRFAIAEVASRSRRPPGGSQRSVLHSRGYQFPKTLR
jgi:hypothetical protein